MYRKYVVPMMHQSLKILHTQQPGRKIFQSIFDDESCQGVVFYFYWGQTPQSHNAICPKYSICSGFSHVNNDGVEARGPSEKEALIKPLCRIEHKQIKLILCLGLYCLSFIIFDMPECKSNWRHSHRSLTIVQHQVSRHLRNYHEDWKFLTILAKS